MPASAEEVMSGSEEEDAGPPPMMREDDDVVLWVGEEGIVGAKKGWRAGQKEPGCSCAPDVCCDLCSPVAPAVPDVVLSAFVQLPRTLCTPDNLCTPSSQTNKVKRSQEGSGQGSPGAPPCI